MKLILILSFLSSFALAEEYAQENLNEDSSLSVLNDQLKIIDKSKKLTMEFIKCHENRCLVEFKESGDFETRGDNIDDHREFENDFDNDESGNIDQAKIKSTSNSSTNITFSE